MRNAFRTLIVLGMLAFSVSAQEREITMAELSTKIMKATAIHNAGPFKTVTETEYFEKKGGTLKDKSRNTREVISSSTLRSITEYLTDKARPTVENVSVGGVKYQRVGDGEWKLITRDGGVMIPVPGTEDKPRPIPIQSKQVDRVFSLGDTELEGKDLVLYEIRTVVTRLYSLDEISEWRVTRRFWFAENGALMKRSEEYDDSRHGIYSVMTMRFVYDNLDLKIEPPILGKVKLDK